MTAIDTASRIVLTRTDYERLSGLSTPSPGMTAARRFLAEELARAEVVEPGEIPPTVVTMNARVAFRDDQTGRTRTVTLVYPGAEDIAQGRVSILAPIGAALIGLSEGQSIEWETLSGDWKSLTVLKVHAQPRADKRAGR